NPAITLGPAVAAVVSSQDPDTGQGNLDIFAVRGDGTLCTSWWRPSTGWAAWTPVGTAQPAPLQPQLFAVVSGHDQPTGFGNFDVFSVGTDGRPYTAWWRPGQSWQWSPLGKAFPPKPLRPGIMAVVGGTDKPSGLADIDVFATGIDGVVYTAFF